MMKGEKKHKQMTKGEKKMWEKKWERKMTKGEKKVKINDKRWDKGGEKMTKGEKIVKTFIQ
jgi:hypothetical protein